MALIYSDTNGGMMYVHPIRCTYTASEKLDTYSQQVFIGRLSANSHEQPNKIKKKIQNHWFVKAAHALFISSKEIRMTCKP